MTRWVAIFEDHPEARQVREQHRKEHFAYLEAHKDKILLGGGLKPAPDEWWEGGLYENDYVKQGGVWKVKVMGHHLTWQGDFETGWAHQQPYDVAFWPKTYPEDPLGPDELSEPEGFWPETSLVPFHYAHPVTGKEVVAEA